MTTRADPTAPEAPSPAYDQDVLRQIARRVLWLSAAIVDAAHPGRPNHSGVKVGGHQASSASMVDIMTALWPRCPPTPSWRNAAGSRHARAVAGCPPRTPRRNRT